MTILRRVETLHVISPDILKESWSVEKSENQSFPESFLESDSLRDTQR